MIVRKKRVGDCLKRFLRMLLFACILFGTLLSVNVFAEDELAFVEIVPKHEKSSGVYYDALDVYIEDMASFRAYLDENLKACNTAFGVEDYRIPAEVATDLVTYIFKDIPEAFHVAKVGYSYRKSTGLMVGVTVSYNTTKAEYDELLDRCKQVVHQMTRGLDAPGLTEAEQALILHDRLALHNEYDHSMKAPYTHEMVGALLYQTSVCEGYAQAYSYLLDSVGIPNYYCRSALIDHGWNIVLIDGVEYHVDVTWDDESFDRPGRVKHDNFLRSSAGFIETGHHVQGNLNGYDFITTPTDPRYDSAYWQNSKAAFQLLGGKLYYLDSSKDGSVKLMQVKGGEHKVLAEIGEEFKTSMGNWGTKHALLASDGVDLLYSAPDAIYRYCTMTKTTEKIWSPDLEEKNAIFGFSYDGVFLICVPYHSPNFGIQTNHTNQIKKAYVAHSHAHAHAYDNPCDDECDICFERRTPPHSFQDVMDLTCELCGHVRGAFVKGDANDSRSLETDDAIYLLFYVNFPANYPIYQDADFDGNGKVDMDDAIYLLFHINYPDAYPLH